LRFRYEIFWIYMGIGGAKNYAATEEKKKGYRNQPQQRWVQVFFLGKKPSGRRNCRTEWEGEFVTGI